MKFYKVINPMNKPLLVKNELVTDKELHKMKLTKKIHFFNSNKSKHDTISSNNIFKEVNISKFDTYWFFGCRFQNGT